MGTQTRGLCIAVTSLFSVLILQLGAPIHGAGFGLDGVGVNWGRMQAFPLPPQLVVRMLQQNGISKVKLYVADPEVLDALANSGIEVMVGIPNMDLPTLYYNASYATEWVQNSVVASIKKGVNIRYIAVGNEVFLTSYGLLFATSIYPAMNNIYKAVQQAGYAKQVKVVTPLNADVLASSIPPSNATFRKELVPSLTDILKLLKQQHAPFIVNIFPYLNLFFALQEGQTISMNFLFFGQGGGNNTFTDAGTGLTYYNMFDATYDSIVHGLEKLGFPDMEVDVGETGWPSDGGPYASSDYGGTYNVGALRKMSSGEGTPYRSDITINGYLFSLLDEELKETHQLGAFERHWGIFDADGIPKYSLDFSGGKNPFVQLFSVPGVKFLPQRWCMAKTKAPVDALLIALNFACLRVDCSPIYPNGSCFWPDAVWNHASFAMNLYWQSQNQSNYGCYFDGYGEVITSNPSGGTCRYRVGIDKAQTAYASRQHVGYKYRHIGAVLLLYAMVTLVFL